MINLDTGSSPGLDVLYGGPSLADQFSDLGRWDVEHLGGLSTAPGDSDARDRAQRGEEMLR